MLIPTKSIRDWKDLQDQVANLFREMGYEVHSPYVVRNVRGSKEVDVYVRDIRMSIPYVILIECKHWGANLPQDVVHSFRSTMVDCGANAGIIVGSTGFQSGAHRAAAHTNIELRTWESLQHSYGNEWFLRQKEKLRTLDADLKLKDRLYLDQWETPRVLMNLMRFVRVGRIGELYDLLEEGRALIFANTSGPRSYDTPGPIETQVYAEWPGAVSDRYGLPVILHENVREWFRWIEQALSSLLVRINALEVDVFHAFDALSDEEADAAFEETLQKIRDEAPIRVLRPLIGEAEYNKLMDLLTTRVNSAARSPTV